MERNTAGGGLAGCVGGQSDLRYLDGGFWTGNTSTDSQVCATSRPDVNGQPTIVRVRYFVIGLREIDSARQTFDADIFWRFRWHDPRLRLDAGVVGTRVLPFSAVWHPGLDVWNSSSIKTTYGDTVEVDPEGNVTYRQRISGRFDAPFNLRDFPFDRQDLLVRILSARYTADEVTFLADEEPSGMAADFNLPEWQVSPPRLEVAPMQLEMADTSRAAFEVRILAKRDSAFYVRKMLVPLFLILMMAYAVLWIEPGQFGPQIGVCTGAIFSFIAFRFSLSVLLPRISYFTRMDQFVYGATLLVFLPLGKAILTTRLLKADRMDWVQRVDCASRWLYPACVLALAWFTLGA